MDRDANRNEMVTRYEQALAVKFGAKHAFALPTPQDAAKATFAAAGVTPGSEVILPVLADYEVAKAVVEFGAMPVFCDVYPGMFVAQSEDMERQVTGKTSALVTTSQWGGLGDFPFHRELSVKTNIPLINFATTGLGSRSAAWSGRQSAIECFGTDKGDVLNIGAGGVILTDDDAMAEKLKGAPVIGPELCAKGFAALETYDERQKQRNQANTEQWNGLYPVMMHMHRETEPGYVLRSDTHNLFFLYKKPQNGLSETPAYDPANPAFKRADAIADFIENTGIIPGYAQCKPKLLTDYPDMAELHTQRSGTIENDFEHARNTLRDIVVLPVVSGLDENEWARLAEQLYYEIVPGTYPPAPNFTATLLSNRLHGAGAPPPPWDFVPDWFKQGHASPV